MTDLSFSLRIGRAAAVAIVAGAVSCVAPAAPSSTSASPSVGATANSRIATKCDAMSGDEKSACERDIRADAQSHKARAHGKKSHAKAAAHAASSSS